MDRAHPAKSPAILHQALPVVGKHRVSVFVKCRLIRQHHHICFPVQFLLKALKLFPVFIGNHVVRVQPHQIIPRPLRERKISGRREIVVPRVAEHAVRVFSRRLPGSVRGTGVHDDYFIRQIPHTVQAAGENLLLIFHYHTQADGNHPGLLSSSLRTLAVLLYHTSAPPNGDWLGYPPRYFPGGNLAVGSKPALKIPSRKELPRGPPPIFKERLRLLVGNAEIRGADLLLSAPDLCRHRDPDGPGVVAA